MNKGNIKRGKRNQKKNFTMVSNSVINDTRLSWKAKGILIYLLSKPENWVAKIEDIYNHASDGYTSLRSGIEDLIICGYMELKNTYDEDKEKFTGRYYEFNEVPLFEKGFRSLENKNKNFRDDEVLLNHNPKEKNNGFIKSK